jgi:hypothetical protein
MSSSFFHRGARINRLVTVAWFVAAIAVLGRFTVLGESEPARARQRLADRLKGETLKPVAVQPPGLPEPIEFSFSSGRPQLVLLLLPTCAACLRTREAWIRLGDEARELRAVVSAFTDDAGDSLTSFAKLGSLWRLVKPSSLLDSFGVDRVPVTLVVSGEGRVVEARVGVLTPRDERALVRQVRKLSTTRE